MTRTGLEGLAAYDQARRIMPTKRVYHGVRQPDGTIKCEESDPGQQRRCCLFCDSLDRRNDWCLYNYDQGGISDRCLAPITEVERLIKDSTN